jgi:hypothetical protein
VTPVTLESHIRSYPVDTMRSRKVSVSIHGALEVIAAPAIMAAPFLLDFGRTATVLSVALGAILLGLALQLEGPRRTIPLSAHAGFDYALATVAVVGGLAIGLSSNDWAAASFLTGIGAALATLAATTRFTSPRGA